MKDIVRLIPFESVNSNTLSTIAYSVINPGGLPFPCFSVFITNASTQDVLISTDGVDPYEYVIKGTRIELICQQNSGPNNQKAYFAKGTVFYASGTAGTGDIVLTALYQPEI